jgi:hypothetical protein
MPTMRVRTIIVVILVTTQLLNPGVVMAEHNSFSSSAPTPEMMAEAKKNPNGWVYVIEGNYGPKDAVPPEAIAGAWKVDATGNIVVGSFQANPKFKSKQ